MNRHSVPDLLGEMHAGNKAHAESHPGFNDVLDGQQPEVILYCCSDSRLHTQMFGENFNQVFPIENAGNRFDTDDLSASATYAADHIPQAKIIYIVGHTGCGAITGAMSEHSEERADLKKYLSEMKGYLEPHSGLVEKVMDKRPEGIDETTFRMTLFAELNVDYQVQKVIDKYSDLIDDGKVAVIGGIYDIHGIYPGPQGTVHTINVEGITDTEEIKKHELYSKVEKEPHRFTEE